jgi:hypothetical protein
LPKRPLIRSGPAGLDPPSGHTAVNRKISLPPLAEAVADRTQQLEPTRPHRPDKPTAALQRHVCCRQPLASPRRLYPHQCTILDGSPPPCCRRTTTVPFIFKFSTSLKQELEDSFHSSYFCVQFRFLKCTDHGGQEDEGFINLLFYFSAK